MQLTYDFDSFISIFNDYITETTRSTVGCEIYFHALNIGRDIANKILQILPASSPWYLSKKKPVND
jgi:hypothetical protein